MNRSIDPKRLRLFLWIGLAYTVIWFLNAVANHPDQLFPRIRNEIWRSLYYTAVNFWFLEYVIPRMSRKRPFDAIGAILFQVFLFSLGLYLWRGLGIGIGLYTEFINFKTIGEAVAAQMSSSMSALMFFILVRHVHDHFRLRQAAQQLRIEKQEAELNYLKSQTNPHFLFNTLNNIYSLARQKSDRAPESILRLSKILRFMLYETSGAYIAVEEELKIMEDYIALEGLRYDDTLQVRFHHDLEDRRQALPPLLLMPLVENAFKHGVSETRQGAFVEIHLSVRNRQLRFEVRNSADGEGAPGVLRENIGLSNLRRQLQLLYSDHRLEAGQQGGVFRALLTINLNSHV